MNDSRFDEFGRYTEEEIDKIIEILRKDGCPEEEIDEIIFLLYDDYTLDAAMDEVCCK